MFATNTIFLSAIVVSWHTKNGVRSKVVADVAVTPVLGKSGVPPIPPNPP